MSGQPHLKDMATKEKKLGNIKRFGARYGRRPKLKYGTIEIEQRKKHKCPYCNNIQVKRIAAGIWECRKCNSKFTGKAYTISRKIITEEESKLDIKIGTEAENLNTPEQTAEES